MNRLIKASPRSCALWAKVLAAVPDSRLMLVLSGDENTRPEVLCRLSDMGLPPGQIDLIPRSPWRRYLDSFRQIDVHLDPLPFNGITTTCDGLWMGCPTVTLAGNTFASRAGVSLLNMVGLPELIAQTEEQYIQIAAGLATDRPRLAELRRTLRRRMLASPLCDGVGFARKLEAAYREMWRRWCESSVNPWSQP